MPFRRLIVAGLSALLLALPVLAQDGAQPPTDLNVLIADHRDDEARALIMAREADSPFLPLYLALLEGRIKLRDKQYDEAISIFRALLTAAPDFLPARLDLAAALRLKGDNDAAWHHLNILHNTSADPRLRGFAERAMNMIEAERPYGFSVSGAILPSTNVNRGSGQATFMIGDFAFDINDDSREQSGVGVSVGGEGFYRFDLGARDSLTATLGGNLTKYLGTDAFDSTGINASLVWTHRAEGFTVSLGPIVGYQWSAWKPHLLRYGVSVGAKAPLSAQDVISASFQALRQDYHSFDYRDGYLISGSVALQHYFSPAFNMIGKLGGTFERTVRDHLDHDDLSVDIRFNNQWEGGLITSIFAGYAHHQYLGDYPLFGAPREDHRLSIEATVSHRALDFGGFTPTLTYQYTRQFSNVSFHDYDSHDMSLGLSKQY